MVAPRRVRSTGLRARPPDAAVRPLVRPLVFALLAGPDGVIAVMRKLIVTIAAVSALSSACKKSEESAADKSTEPSAETATKPVEPEAPAKPAAQMPPAEVGSWQEIPNVSGFVADVPSAAVPNAVGGAAGFHAADDSYGMMFREEAPEEAAKDMDT